MTSDRQLLRQALSRFATGICVITTLPKDGPAQGMTVNSFASVSLEPALVLWSIQNDSECFPLFNTAQRYAINILGAEQQALSDRYAKKGDHTLEPDHYSLSPGGTPLLKQAICSLDCALWQRYPAGDHTIIIGEIMATTLGETDIPLLFSSGKYRRLEILQPDI